MGHIIDITGQRFGAWTVIKKSLKAAKEAFWVCRCDCGTERVLKSTLLRKGKTKSCGCLKAEYLRRANLKHGESVPDTPLYYAWRHMRTKQGRVKIPICEEWNEYFVFAEWARRHGYRQGLILSRIDLRLGWYPENTCFKTKMNHPRGIIKRYPPIPKIRADGTRRPPHVD